MSYNSTLCEVTFKFYQEGNTNGTNGDTEELDIILETVAGDAREDGYFITLKTNTGWSFNDRKEMNDLYYTLSNYICKVNKGYNHWICG